MFFQKDVVPVCKACNRICVLTEPRAVSVKSVGATLLGGPWGWFAATYPYYQCPGCLKKYADLRKAARKNEIVFRKFTPNVPTYDPNEGKTGDTRAAKPREGPGRPTPTGRTATEFDIAKAGQLFADGYHEAVLRRDSKRAHPLDFDDRPEAYRAGYTSGFSYGTKQCLADDCRRALNEFIEKMS